MERQPFAAVASKLGVWVITTGHDTQREAEMAARRMIREGKADSVAVWDHLRALSYFGSGR